MRQPFHLVQPSIWPISAAVAAFGLVSSWFFPSSIWINVLFLILVASYWFRDVTREATYCGDHTQEVTNSHRIGMVLFIVSEVMFFFAFFWAFFHSSLSPAFQIGCMWPPMGINPLSPFSIPLLNTAILLASGITLTWSHHAITHGNKTPATTALIITILLGMYFLSLQATEYSDAPFTIADGVYGSTFFMTTGFHGFHVLMGTMLLLGALLRLVLGHYSTTAHFGFEAAAWYWHFVDVVWIFLYLSMYCWGS